MGKKRVLSVPPGYVLIFRPYYTKDGVRIYAKRYGLKAWPLLVPVTK
jgi:hypothetical protein